MKATRANLLGEFTGNLDELIYYKNSRTGKIYVRRRFTFKDHPGQPAFTSAQKAIYALKPSNGYRQNLRDYLLAYNSLPANQSKPALFWGNLYNKLMFAMQKKLPQVDLKTITRAQIVEQNLPCITVKAAVEAGLLPEVKDYQRFTQQI